MLNFYSEYAETAYLTTKIVAKLGFENRNDLP